MEFKKSENEAIPKKYNYLRQDPLLQMVHSIEPQNTRGRLSQTLRGLRPLFSSFFNATSPLCDIILIPATIIIQHHQCL
jgi:hypothetical protein